MPFIWFQLFDVGLLRKSVSIETILSLMQHTKSCVSEKLVYCSEIWRVVWVKTQNRKNPNCTEIFSYICGCANYLYPVDSQCFTVLYPTYGETFTLHSAGSRWERTVSKISNSSWKDSVLASHITRERSPAFNKLSAFHPKSQELDHPCLIYPWCFFWSEWNHPSCSLK